MLLAVQVTLLVLQVMIVMVDWEWGYALSGPGNGATSYVSQRRLTWYASRKG